MQFQNLNSMFAGVFLTLFISHSLQNVANAQIFDVKPNFFANIEACIASGEYLKSECHNAFENARRQLLDLAPKFSSFSECRFRFKLCELEPANQTDSIQNTDANDESLRILPSILGVEIIRLERGLYASSVLAVEIPSELFPRFSLAETYENKESMKANAYSAIRPSDVFEPFPSLKNHLPVNAFVLKDNKKKHLHDEDLTTQVDTTVQAVARDESEVERQSRIKLAPFLD